MRIYPLRLPPVKPGIVLCISWLGNSQVLFTLLAFYIFNHFPGGIDCNGIGGPRKGQGWGRRGKGGIRGLDRSGKAERGGHERYMCWVGREQSSEDGIQTGQ